MLVSKLALDAKSTALVLIDLQQSNVARQLAPHSAAEVVRNSARLADALRERGGTVIYVRVLIAEVPQRPVDAPSPGAPARRPRMPRNWCPRQESSRATW